MRKSTWVLIVLLCLGCSKKKVQDSPKFSDEQIAQLRLSNVKPLRVIEKNSKNLDFNSFLSEKEISAKELVDSIEFIPLETTNESLIAEINKIICIEKFFFIFDSDIGKNVFIFFSDGRFVKRIATGQGPEEIYNPGDIAVDEENGHLIVYNRKGLSFYDYQGNFVKRELLPFNFKNFRVLPNGYLFVTIPNQNGHLEELSAMQVLITDKKFRIISAGFPFHYSNSLNYGITDYTSSLDNNVNFAFKFSNKIFHSIDTLSVEEKYELDFSQKELPTKYLEMSTKEVLDMLRNNNYYYYMGDYIENNMHEYFTLYNDYNQKAYQTFVFRDKSSGRLKGGNKLKLDTIVPLFSYPLSAYKDRFIGAISSQSILYYMSETKKEGIKNSLFTQIKDDSNPIIVKYKLKKY